MKRIYFAFDNSSFCCWMISSWVLFWTSHFLAVELSTSQYHEGLAFLGKLEIIIKKTQNTNSHNIILCFQYVEMKSWPWSRRSNTDFFYIPSLRTEWSNVHYSPMNKSSIESSNTQSTILSFSTYWLGMYFW